jgi:hypothetical protein
MRLTTISLRAEAYERLCRARRHPSETFSDVVLRASWPNVGITARELLVLYESERPFLTEETLDRIDAIKSEGA